MVKLPVAGDKFVADMKKVEVGPGVPAVVEISVTVPLGEDIVGCKTVPDTATFTVVAPVLVKAILPE